MPLDTEADAVSQIYSHMEACFIFFQHNKALETNFKPSLWCVRDAWLKSLTAEL